MAKPKNTRPHAEEQAGQSEFSTSAAGLESAAEETDAQARPGGPPREDDLSRDPEELGQDYLKGATQQQANTRPAESETSGGPLRTENPDRTETEREVSEKTRQKQKEEGDPHVYRRD